MITEHLRAFRFRPKPNYLEGSVDGAVHGVCCAAQTIQVCDGTSMDSRTGIGQLFGGSVGACEARDLMARFDQFPDDGSSDEPCGPGDKNTHNHFSLLINRTRSFATVHWAVAAIS